MHCEFQTRPSGASTSGGGVVRRADAAQTPSDIGPRLWRASISRPMRLLRPIRAKDCGAGEAPNSQLWRALGMCRSLLPLRLRPRVRPPFRGIMGASRETDPGASSAAVRRGLRMISRFPRPETSHTDQIHARDEARSIRHRTRTALKGWMNVKA